MPALDGLRNRRAGISRAVPILLGVMLLLIPAVAGASLRSAHAFVNGQNASVVVGQVNFGSASQYRPNLPEGVAFDSSGNMWVADYVNSRILRFPAPVTNGVAANLVIGQTDFVSNGFSTSQTGLEGPVAISFDSSGNLWVTDTYNNRILRFSAPFTSGMAASLVIGQQFYTTSLGQGTTTQNSLYRPYDARFDSLGNLWVADCGNSRVLRFSPPFANNMNANMVIGQVNFAGFSPGTSQTQLDCPVSLVFDSTGGLWVSDYYNNRVLGFGNFFTAGMAAKTVIGQSSFTTNTASSGTAGLYGPWDITVDSSGNLWVVDSSNYRVLAYVAPFSNGMSPTVGLGGGQAWFQYPVGVAIDGSGNLWVGDADNSDVLEFSPPFSTGEGTTTIVGQGQNTLTYPYGIFVDPTGSLWVADRGNDRVLRFSPPFSNGMNANVAIGQPTFSSNSPATSKNTLSDAVGITMDASGNLWVADTVSNRILRFSPPFTTGMSANLVLGQTDFTSFNPATSQSGLNYSSYVAFDSSGSLWVADTDNNRVMRFSPPFSSGMSANLVIGQSGYASDTSAVTQDGFYNPTGIVFDSSGNLWVSDYGNNRVLRFSAPFSSGMSASLVLGQSTYTTRTNSSSQTGFHNPEGVAFDPRGNLWVVDHNNNRALRFVPPFSSGMGANLVIGQSGFTSSASGATPNIMNHPRSEALDSAGNLWVTDSFNGRALQFTCGAECPPSTLAMSYSVQGGGSVPTPPTLTYMSGGVPVTATLGTSAASYSMDYGSTWSVTGTVTGSASNERWMTTQVTSGTATSAQAFSFNYYHQYNVRFGFNITGGGTGYGSPGVTYSQFGVPTTSSAGSTIWVDAGSSYSYPSTLQGSTASERWFATSTSGVVNSAAAVTSTYYHQYAFTNTFTISGGGSPSPPTLTSSSLGASVTSTLSATGQSLWLDAGASYSLTNPLGGSSAAERWYTPSPTGKVTGAVNSLVYFHQYSVSAGYSVVGGGSPPAPTLNSTALGSPTSIALSSSSSQSWLDAGAAYAIRNPLASSTSTERWQTGAATAGTVSSSSSLNLVYYHQFSLTVSYALVGGGTPTAPSLSYTVAGAAAQSSLSTSPQTLWADAGAQYSSTNPLASSTSSERWTAPSTAGSATASASLVFQYQHQFLVTFAPTDNSGKPIVPSNLTIAIQGGGQQTIQGNSAWLNSGTSFTVSQLLWQGTDVKPAQSQVTVSSAASVPIKALIFSATVKVTDFLGLPVSGATVKMTLANGTTITGTTGGDGTFVAPAIPLGPYTATVSGIASSTQVKGDASKQAVATASVTFGTTSLAAVAGIVVMVALLAIVLVRRRSKGGAPKQAQAAKPTMTQPQTVKCPNCGTMVDSAEAFCPNCGTKVR